MRSYGDDQDVNLQTQQHEEEAQSVPDEEVEDGGNTSDAQWGYYRWWSWWDDRQDQWRPWSDDQVSWHGEHGSYDRRANDSDSNISRGFGSPKEVREAVGKTQTGDMVSRA